MTIRDAPHAMHTEEEALLLDGAERGAPLPRQRLATSIVRVGAVSALVVTLLLAPAALVVRSGRESKAARVVASSADPVRDRTVEFTTIAEPVYTRHEDKNAYAPFGAEDIDTGRNGVNVTSEEACKMRCTNDPRCDCVTWFEPEGKCWKRSKCIVQDMTSPYNKGYAVLVKSEAELKLALYLARKMEEENSDYLTWHNKNAYAPFGAVDLDGSTGIWASDHLDCQDRCTKDPMCDCVTFGFSQCWKRCNCQKDNMTSGYNAGYTVFKKKAGAAAECPKPCVFDNDFRDNSLESLKRREEAPALEQAQLVWSDDFDGSEIDSEKWDVREDGLVFNGELQMYKSDGNAKVEDGVLRIAAKCEDYRGQHYTSAKLHSRMLFRAGHRMEAKLRMSAGNGTWPAFWMMGEGRDPWPKIGEIDVLEYVGCSKEVMGNLHYEHRHGDNGFNTYRQSNFDVNEWHTYRVDWLSQGMVFHVDGKIVSTVPAQNCYDDWPYNTNKFYIILNLALGGSLGGWCLGDQKPSCDHFMDVDWVKVFKIE